MHNEVENIYTWWFDSATIILRYFVLAGTGYLIFYIWKIRTFSKAKIQDGFPGAKAISKEIVFSVLTLLIYCGVSWLVFYCQKAGITKIYLDIDQYGLPYLMFSVVIMVIIHDAYFYWTHRLMHLPGIFKTVHQIHHHSNNPTPWAAFSFHPLEAIISIGIIPLIVFFMPSHPFALFAFLSYMTLINAMGHLGYETFPLGFRKSTIGKWQNTSTNHNIHHQNSQYNYGLYFTFWDRLMHTYNGNDNK